MLAGFAGIKKISCFSKIPLDTHEGQCKIALVYSGSPKSRRVLGDPPPSPVKIPCFFPRVKKKK